MTYRKNIHFVLFIIIPLFLISCSRSQGNAGIGNNPRGNGSDTTGLPVKSWVTTGDQSKLLQKQADIYFDSITNNNAFIDVDSTQSLQTIDGFGYTLTGGSAFVINQLSPTSKANLLKELFATDSTSVGISYLRISIGASDLNSTVFSYDDIPSGQTDPNLDRFSLDKDRIDLIPLLKEILLLNPHIKIVATPWSPPVWMKDNASSVGGSLITTFYGTYARYFVKYIQQMKAEGIPIDAITPQNEPLNPGNNPSLLMTADQEGTFVKNNLGPAFRDSGINTKIIIYDHNCDHPDYPLTILQDSAANPFVDGSAFHLYAGDISALSQVHSLFPGKQLYFMEQYTASTGDFAGDLRWHIKNVIIGSIRNWSRNALEWNLANDLSFGPHTPGGCTTCKGALTIGATVTRNVAYYIIAQASKFVPPGSYRIGSNIPVNFQNVAFRTPAGRKVLIVENDGTNNASFNIRYKGKWASASLESGAVGTFIW